MYHYDFHLNEDACKCKFQKNNISVCAVFVESICPLIAMKRFQVSSFFNKLFFISDNTTQIRPSYTKLLPYHFPASIIGSAHHFQAANSPLSKMKTFTSEYSFNRCHGNIIATAAITALCLTNSHKSFSLHKEDVVVLHSHPIIRNCSMYGVTSGH